MQKKLHAKFINRFERELYIIPYFGGACFVDDNTKVDYGVTVWSDDGNWNSLTIGAHELGHTYVLPLNFLECKFRHFK